MKLPFLAIVLSALSLEAETVAHYRFDSMATDESLLRLVDSSGRGHHGRVIGREPFELTKDAAPVPGNQTALDARGRNDYAIIPHHADFAPTGDWTIEFFVKAPPFHQDFGGATNIAGSWAFLNSNLSYTIIAKPVADQPTLYGSAWAFHYQPATGYVVATISLGADKGETLLAGKDMRDGEWHHIAMAVHKGFGTEIRLYVDGYLTMSINAQGGDQPIAFGSDPIYVGAFSRQNEQYTQKDRNFDGFLDEVRFSDASLDTQGFLADLTLKEVQPEIHKAIELRLPTANNELYRIEGSADGIVWNELGHLLGDDSAKSFFLRDDGTGRRHRVVLDAQPVGDPVPFTAHQAVELRFPTGDGQLYRIAWTPDLRVEGGDAAFVLGDGGMMSHFERITSDNPRFYTVNRY